MQPSAIIDSGIDYATYTYGPTANIPLLGVKVAQSLAQEVREGNFKTNWSWNSYIGERAGGVEWGSRHDGSIVRLSGYSAQRWWQRFGKLATNCTRLDAQETYVFEDGPTAAMAWFWRQMDSWWKEKPHRPEPKKIEGPRGIETIYSGSRSSDVFLRLYHRGRKKGLAHCEGHIRFEAEFKGHVAHSLWDLFSRERGGARPIVSQGLAKFQERGADITWSGVEKALIQCRVKQSDALQCLTWLRNGVRPSVLKLIDKGYGEEVLEALGLIEGPQLRVTKRKET